MLGERRLDFRTSEKGATLWLVNGGAQYQLTDNLAVFGSIGTSLAATSALAPSNIDTMLGIDLTLPIGW